MQNAGIVSLLVVSVVLIALPCRADAQPSRSFDNERLALEQELSFLEERLNSVRREEAEFEENARASSPDGELREQALRAIDAVRARLRMGDARAARRARAIATAAVRLLEVRFRTRRAQQEDRVARREHAAALVRRDRATEAASHARARLAELRESENVSVRFEGPSSGAGGSTSDRSDEP